MSIRLCTAALVLATSPYVQPARSADQSVKRQGLWSQALRDRTFTFTGAAPAEAGELGTRYVAGLPSGAQSALRLMRATQSELGPDLRDPVELGTEDQLAARTKSLEARAKAEDERLATVDRYKEDEQKLTGLESRVGDATDKFRDSEVALTRAEDKLAAQEHSYYCSLTSLGALGSLICRWGSSPERSHRDAIATATGNLKRDLDDRTKELGEVRRRLTVLGRDTADPKTIEERRAAIQTDADALVGFYRTTPSPTCRRRLVFHARSGVRLRESPLLNGPVSDEDVDLGTTTLHACVDAKRRLAGVEISDDHGERLAVSELGRDRAGRLTHVRIFDHARTLLEDHHYPAETSGYDVTFRGPKGERVRATAR